MRQMLTNMTQRGLVTTIPDPSDGRAKIVKISRKAERIRREAERFASRIEDVLRHRIGDETYDQLLKGLNRDWGPPLQTAADPDLKC